MGTMVETNSLAGLNLQASRLQGRSTDRDASPPDPIMRRLYADREEKRVTRGSDISGQDGEQEQLDLNDPNQRTLLVAVSIS